MSGTQATEALFGWLYKQPGMATLEDVWQVAFQIEHFFGKWEMQCIFQRFGTSQPADLWIGLYEGFCTFGQACLEFNRPPSAAWDGDTPYKAVMPNPTMDQLFEDVL